LSSPLDIEPRPIEDEAAHVELALRMRPELEEARLRLEQNRLATIATGNGLLPRLDFFVQLTKTGFGSSFAEAVSALTGPTYEVAAGLSFEQLLGNDVATGEDEAAHLRRERAERAVANLEELVELDVRLALVELARAREQIEASRRTRELVQRVVEAERERVNVGESTPLLLATAERDLVEAEVAEAEALVAYRIAMVRLFAAEGSLLQRSGIELAE
ncbi:MAG TPA: TolC family protein, partial [Sandaracinaceae bacterium]